MLSVCWRTFKANVTMRPFLLKGRWGVVEPAGDAHRTEMGLVKHQCVSQQVSVNAGINPDKTLGVMCSRNLTVLAMLSTATILWIKAKRLAWRFPPKVVPLGAVIAILIAIFSGQG
jgi:hypothetical protein